MSLTLQKTLAPLPLTTRGKPASISYNSERRRFAYPVGNNVVLRSIDDESDFDLFEGHVQPVTAVCFSPNGAYMASGDQSGLVLVWDTINREEHIVKLEKEAFSGPVAEISWSGDGQRIAACGQGRESFGCAFSLSGSNIGEISGHGKRVNACDFKKQRPFRVATGGDDLSLNFHRGPPFRFEGAFTGHTRSINAVKFRPDGAVYLSAGGDKKVFAFEGKTGELIAEFPVAHKGGIYGLAWEPTAPHARFATVSADKTLKVWNYEEQTLAAEVVIGTTILDQALGIQWTDKGILVVTLNGMVHLYAVEDAALNLVRVYGGHGKPVTSLEAINENTIVSGALDGSVAVWNVEEAHATNVGMVHSAEVRDIVKNADGVLTFGADDTSASIAISGYSGDATTSPTAGAVLVYDCSADGSVTAAATSRGAEVNGEVITELGEVTSVAVAQDGSEIAFGTKTGKIIVVRPGEKTACRNLEYHRSPISALAYGPSNMLLSGDRNKRVVVWKESETPAVTGLEFHNGRVRRVAWCPDGRHFASAGNDGQLIVWDLENPRTRRTVPRAHRGAIHALSWLDETRVVTGGDDGCLRVFSM